MPLNIVSLSFSLSPSLTYMLNPLPNNTYWDALGSINATVESWTKMKWYISTSVSSIEVRANLDDNMHPGEATILLRPTIDADGQRKPREWVEDHSIGQPNVVHGGGSARNDGGRQEQERRHKDGLDNSFRPSTSRGSQIGTKNQQEKANTECWYCDRKGHTESECWKAQIYSFTELSIQ